MWMDVGIQWGTRVITPFPFPRVQSGGGSGSLFGCVPTRDFERASPILGEIFNLRVMHGIRSAFLHELSTLGKDEIQFRPRKISSPSIILPVRCELQQPWFAYCIEAEATHSLHTATGILSETVPPKSVTVYNVLVILIPWV